MIEKDSRDLVISNSLVENYQMNQSQTTKFNPPVLPSFQSHITSSIPQSFVFERQASIKSTPHLIQHYNQDYSIDQICSRWSSDSPEQNNKILDSTATGSWLLSNELSSTDQNMFLHGQQSTLEVGDNILPAMNSLMVSNQSNSDQKPIDLINESNVATHSGSNYFLHDEINEKSKKNIQVPHRTKVYKCKQCSFTCRLKEDFWNHQRTHIRPDKLLECPRCSFITEYKHHLEYHLRNHIGSKPFKCIKCHYSCVNLSMLRSHMKSHLRPSQYRCDNCAFVSRTFSGLQVHTERAKHSPASEAVALASQRNQIRRAIIPRPFDSVGQMRYADEPNVSSMQSNNAMNLSVKSELCDSAANSENENVFPSASLSFNDSLPFASIVDSTDSSYKFESTQAEHIFENAVTNKTDEQMDDQRCGNDDSTQQSSDQPSMMENYLTSQTQISNEDDPLIMMEMESVKANMNAHLRCGVCDYLAPSRHDMNTHLLYHASNSDAAKGKCINGESQYILEEKHDISTDVTSENACLRSEDDNEKPKRRRKGKAQRIISIDSYKANALDLRTSNEDITDNKQVKDIRVSHSNWIMEHDKSSNIIVETSSFSSSPSLDGRLFECEFCGILFRSFAMYCTHKMFHSPNEPFRCNQCGQLYEERVEFFVHVAKDAHELR